MSDTEYDILDVLHEMLDTERSFYGIIRFLDNQNRGRIIDAHMRNRSQMLAIMRAYMLSSPVTSMVLNIPLGNLDASGNFFDNVPVFPTSEQIADATEVNVPVVEATCSICRDEVMSATRIRHCGHTFHASCINQWFTMNPRCPVCRYDIRNIQTASTTISNESSSVHTDTE